MEREVALLVEKNSISTITYEEFDFDKLKEELRKLGVETSNDQMSWCG